MQHIKDQSGIAPTAKQKMESKMSPDTKTMQDSQNRNTADFEELKRQLSSLREDMTGLSQSVKSIAERRSSAIAADVAEGLQEAKNYAQRTGKNAEVQIESSVAAHPFLAVGLAAGVGMLLGAMSRR